MEMMRTITRDGDMRAVLSERTSRTDTTAIIKHRSGSASTIA